MAVATYGAAAIRRERALESERAQPSANPSDERPAALAPARGIALAVALGVIGWALVIVAVLRF